ncbi:MAG: PIN domain-containing protein [Chloroflexota bacterium]
MAAYVADTHSLFWYFTRPERFGAGARAALDQVAAGSATLIVPVIVLAELIYLIQNKPVGGDLDEILRELQSNPAVVVNHAKFRKVTVAAGRRPETAAAASGSLE